MAEGSEWIKAQLPFWRPGTEMSGLGVRVADLLGEWKYGIYHLDPKALKKVNWANTNYIEFTLGWTSLSTVDFNELTRLVFLAHHCCLRIDIDATTRKHLRMLFHPRSRNGVYSQRHPDIQEALNDFLLSVSLPHYED
jgi:hypothetical protein